MVLFSLSINIILNVDDLRLEGIVHVHCVYTATEAVF